jgi:isocitrate/isopropylmalate dehydrogenase
MMPDNWREQLSSFDAIYFGAVGWPDKVPDHISLWGLCSNSAASSTSTPMSAR